MLKSVAQKAIRQGSSSSSLRRECQCRRLLGTIAAQKSEPRTKEPHRNAKEDVAVDKESVRSIDSTWYPRFDKKHCMISSFRRNYEAIASGERRTDVKVYVTGKETETTMGMAKRWCYPSANKLLMT